MATEGSEASGLTAGGDPPTPATWPAPTPPERLERAFAAAPVGMAICGSRLEVERANDALARLLALPPDELIGRPLSAHAHPEDVQRAREHEAAARTGRPPAASAPWRLLAAGGATVWVEVTMVATHAGDDVGPCFVAHVLDVTDRVNAEAELVHQRERLADAQAVAHVGSWVWDMEADTVVASDEMMRIWGMPLGEPYEVSDIAALVHDADRKDVRIGIQQVREQGTGTTRYRIRRPGGGVRWILSHHRLVDEHRMVGTVQDITERLEEEDRRRYAEALFTQAIEYAPTGMAVVSLDGRFLRANRVLEELTGYTKDELLAHNFIELVAPDAVDHALEQHRRMLSGEKERYEAEEPCLRKDGTTLWVLLSVSPLRGSTGAVRAFIVQVQDMTERRAAAQALRESARAAREASAMKSQFLANMSHEIRTPMNGVIGMIDALTHSGLRDDQEGYAAMARSSAEALLTVIDDVLDFSKIEAGRVELEVATFDLLDMLLEIRTLLWAQAQSRRLRVHIIVPPQEPTTVRGDPIRVRQVLINLMTNAIKFSMDGEVVVRVARDAGDLLRFTVTDPGIGIAPEVLEAIFEPFTQADASTTRRFGGTGLGLAISRQLAELMGGELAASSVPGVGSTFWFTAALPAAPDAEQPHRTIPGLDGVRVLVVAPREVQQEMLTSLIARWGVRVVTAGYDDAEQVQLLAAAQGDAPSLAVLAHPDGHEHPIALVQRLRSRGAELTAVAISVHPPPPSLPEGVVALTTPIHLDQIGRALQTLTQAEASAASAGAPATGPGAAPGLGAGRRVLVAEDNVVNQQVAVLSLQRLGFTVDTAGNGAEAVAAAAGTPYDLIFMDCHMPEMDGFEATEAIRVAQATGAPAAPIIAMTASSMTEDRERCRAAGMDDFLAKPVRPGELEAVLRRWLPVG